MKNSKKDLIVTVLFVTFIIAVFLGTVFTNAKVIAWNVIKNNERYITDDSVNSKVRSYVTAYENSFNDSIYIKNKCVDLFGLLQKAMGKQVIPTNGFTGTIVKGSDNKLYTTNSVTDSNSRKDYSDEDITKYADSLIKLKSQLSEINIEFLYVQAPQKYHSDVKTPISINGENADIMVKKTLGRIDGKVDYIDFNRIIDKNNIDRNDVFFKTDHHWTVESAFLCYQSICEYINDNFSFSIDPYTFDRNNWNFDILKNSFLGSTGVRVGKYYVGKDDFAMFTPKFDTSFVRNYTSTRIVTYSGDFKHAIINNYDLISSNNYKDLSWGCYCGADTSFVSIENNYATDDKKILVVKDSFALPICAFLSTTCKHLDICDLRYYDSPVLDIVKKGKYDLVIFIYHPDSFYDTLFDLQK